MQPAQSDVWSSGVASTSHSPNYRRVWLTVLVLVALLLCARLPSARSLPLDDDEEAGEDYSLLTYGSAIRLRHRSSSFHLHSHGINYGSGSGQQSVTAVGQDDDTGSLWQVREAYGTPGVPIGTPIHCGDSIRLQHVGTRRYLHSHLHTSPLTNKQEVSGYGEGSHSDTSDNWRIDCPAASGLHFGSPLPTSTPLVAFVHVDTGKALYTRRADEFNQHNCRGCPIVGQLEVSAAASSAANDQHALWAIVDSGISFPVSAQQRQQHAHAHIQGHK